MIIVLKLLYSSLIRPFLKNDRKIIQHIKEYHYQIEANWSISIYSGTSVEDKTIIKSRKSATTLITQSRNKGSALPEHKIYSPLELSLTWLLQQIDTKELTSQFKVDTEDDKTKTPCRSEATQSGKFFSPQLAIEKNITTLRFDVFTYFWVDFLKLLISH